MLFNTRMKWIRERLDLGLSEAARGADVNKVNLFYWENGGGPQIKKDFIKLVEYYDDMWQKVYPNGGPCFNGQPIDYITLDFVLKGNNDHIEAIKAFYSQHEKSLKRELIYLASEIERNK